MTVSGGQPSAAKVVPNYKYGNQMTGFDRYLQLAEDTQKKKRQKSRAKGGAKGKSLLKRKEKNPTGPERSLLDGKVSLPYEEKRALTELFHS